MTVLTRKSTVWDDVEGIFRDELRKLSATKDDLHQLLMEIFHDDGRVRSIKNESSFTLKWIPEIPPVTSSVFAARLDRSNVLGTIVATIPYVLVRGSANCEELRQCM